MKRRKLLYLPGMISLVGLPLLLFWLGPVEKPRPVLIRMYLPRDGKSEFLLFSKYTVLDEVRRKKVVRVALDDTPYDEIEMYRHQSRLAFITREIERIQFTNDTSSVLKIELGFQTSYSNFIWLINQALIYNVKRYSLVDDSLYLFANEPPSTEALPQLELLYCGGPIVNELPVSTRPTKWEKFISGLHSVWQETLLHIKQNYLLIGGFILLIIVPFFFKIRRYWSIAR